MSFDHYIKLASQYLHELKLSLLYSSANKQRKSITVSTYLYLGALYLIGLAIWMYFLNFGDINWGIQDWVWEYRYLSVLREGLLNNSLPLYIEPELTYGVTRFFGIPDAPFAPQFYLLKFININMMLLVNIGLMHTISFIGCLLLRARYRLSLLPFTSLVFLLTFNGFITAHLGIGHTLFSGYFYLPVFVYLVLRLLDGGAPKSWFLWMSLTMLGMELQGTTQLFAISFFFLVLLFLLNKPTRLQILLGMMLTILLTLFRTAPALLTLGDQPSQPYAGYVSLGDLLRALAVIIPPENSFQGVPLGWWELDIYVGVIGVLFILVFGIFSPWVGESAIRRLNPSYKDLYVTLTILTLFSIGYFYMPINLLPIPLVSLIDVPPRFMVLPLIFTSTIAVIQFQRWLNEHSSSNPYVFLFTIGTGILIHDLIAHTRVWRHSLVALAFRAEPYHVDFKVTQGHDLLYENIVMISAIISAIALVVCCLVLVFIRVRRTQEPAG